MSRYLQNWLQLGLGALAFTMAASAQSIWVANGGSATIATINVATGTASQSPFLGGAVGGVAITPDGGTIYASLTYANTVSVISTFNNSLAATLNVGATPGHLAASPNGAWVYVVNEASNSVSVISNSTRSVVATIPVGSRPISVAFSPDSSRAYVANSWGATISVINTSTYSVTNTFNTGATPSSAAVTPDGKHIYVTCQSANAVTVLDSAGNPSATITGLTTPVSIAITPDGTRAYVVNMSSSTVSVINTSTNTISGTIAVGSSPTWVAVSSDGSQVYVTNEYGYDVSIIAASNNSITKTISSAGYYPIVVVALPVNQGPNCTFQVNPSSAISFPQGGGSTTLNVTASASTCSWGVAGPNWVTLRTSTTSGSGTVTLSAPANNSTQVLSGTITVAGQSFSISEAALGCTYALSGSGSLPSASGSGSVTVTAPSGCAWSVTGNPSWTTITSPPSVAGSGSGTVTYTYTANTATTMRTGNITIAGQNFALSQAAAASSSVTPLATQSSTLAGFGPAGASNAIDGNTDGNFYDHSVSHTNQEANAWWEVDLGTTTSIGSIKIWGRTDCCSDRLSDYWVFVSNTPFLATDTPATLQGRAGTWSNHQTTYPNPSTTITANTSGRYVRVQLSGTNYLSLAEVQFSTGTSTPADTNMAIGKAAAQSSILSGFGSAGPSNAVDGNTDGNFYDHSVSHTNADANAWWQVDLGSAASITSVTVWGRTDCCSDRLSDYWVFVSNTPFAATDTPATLQSRAGTWSSHQTNYPNPSKTISAGVQGRYVRVQLSGTNYLQLAEVQVMGH